MQKMQQQKNCVAEKRLTLSRRILLELFVNSSTVILIQILYISTSFVSKCDTATETNIMHFVSKCPLCTYWTIVRTCSCYDATFSTVFFFPTCMLLHLLYLKPTLTVLLNTLSHPHFKTLNLF
jgi:hypothetical protein